MSQVFMSREDLQKYIEEEKRKALESQVVKRPKYGKATLSRLNIGGWEFYVNASRGLFPVFSYIIKGRIKRKKAINMVFVGEPGEGKSYECWEFFRVIDKRFGIDQVVFKYGEYMKQIILLKMGRPVMFDEPSYAMSKRNWYKEINKALVFTIESVRFKVHPLGIPIINMNLLDKTLRTYLIQYMIQMIDRGKARVYRLFSKQHEEGYYRYHLCDLIYGLQDREECNRDTCLDCGKIDKCEVFRAQYERKKRDIQDKRYADSLQQFTEKESKELRDKDIEQLLLTVIPRIQNKKGEPDPTQIRIVLEDDWNITIGRNRSYKIAKGLEIRYPGKFSIEEDAISLSPRS